MRYSYVDSASPVEMGRASACPPQWPAPEVRARVVALGAPEVCRGPRIIARAAGRAGWTVVATYARGTDPGKRVPRVVDSLALRMWRGGRRAVAVWHDGDTEMAYLFGDRPLERCLVTTLRGALT